MGSLEVGVLLEVRKFLEERFLCDNLPKDILCIIILRVSGDKGQRTKRFLGARKLAWILVCKEVNFILGKKNKREMISLYLDDSTQALERDTNLLNFKCFYINL